MDLPEGYESGWCHSDDVMWHVRRDFADRALCGQRVDSGGRVPKRGFFSWLNGPRDPATAHQRCLVLLAEVLADPDAPPAVSVPSGLCPVCGERVQVVGGFIAMHGGCAGAGQAPKRVKL